MHISLSSGNLCSLADSGCGGRQVADGQHPWNLSGGSGALWKPEAASGVRLVFPSGSITPFVYKSEAEPLDVMLICAG